MILLDTQRSSAQQMAQQVFPAARFTVTPKKETYDDPSKNYGFYIAVRMGDSTAQNSYHPSHPILQRLKNENYKLANLPTDQSQAIHIDGFYFHRIPHPKVEDLHKVNPLADKKRFLFNAVIEGMNKNVQNRSYQYQIFNPVDLILKHTKDNLNYSNHISLNFQNSNGKEQTLEKSFSYDEMYGYGDQSLFIGWLENTVSNIIDQSFTNQFL